MGVRFDSNLGALASVDADALHRLHEGRPLVMDGVLGPPAAATVRAEALARREAGRLRPAGVGGHARLDRAVRGDVIEWLDPGDRSPLAPVLDLFEALRRTLNRDAYLGAGEVEAQLAVYEPGAGYAAHFDQPRGRDGRLITLIYYANSWRAGDGGELEVLCATGPALIEPVADRLVLFRSELLEHGVRPARRLPRVAVSGWLRRG